MDDYGKLKQSADKTNAENKTTWENNAQQIKDAIKKAGELQAYFRKALTTHQNNAKLAQAEYGGWSKLAESIIEKQAQLAEAKKAKDKAAIAGAEKELKKLEKSAQSYQTNISNGVEQANGYMTDVRARIEALEAITF